MKNYKEEVDPSDGEIVSKRLKNNTKKEKA